MLPSTVGGEARTFVSASAVTLAPIVPSAGRTVAPPSIRHEYPAPGSEPLESQVQSTAAPVPVPVPTTFPVTSFTVTVHGRSWLNRAVNRIGPPSVPETTGAYSFGKPVRATCWAIAGRSRYRASPGHSVKYVSR